MTKTTSEKKYTKDEGTVIAYHRYVQGRIAERLNSVELGPGYTPCLIAKILFPVGLVFLAIGLFVILLRPHHLYLVGSWPRFLGPFFVILFMLCFGAAVYFFDLASKRSNKYRRQLKFQAYGLYGTKVIHESHVDREKMIKQYKSGTTPHKSTRTHRAQRHGYPHRKGANNEGYEGTGEKYGDRPRRVEGSERPAYRDHPYSDHAPPKYRDVAGDSERYDPRRGERTRRDDPRSERGERSRYERDDQPRYDRTEKPRYERDDRPRDDQPRYDRTEKPRYERDDRPRYDRDDQPRYDRDEPQPRFSTRSGEGLPRDQGQPRQEYATVDKGRRGRYTSQDDRKDPRMSVTRYEVTPDKFYDEVPPETAQPAEEHHVVSRRTAQPARYSERYIDEGSPMVASGRQHVEIQFDTDTQDSAV